MRLLRALAALVLLSLLTVACTDDGPDPGDPFATWSPTGKMETPTPSPSAPVEPVLPNAAAEASEAGARAFIEHYWDLVNYAQATGDVKPLKAASGDTCEGCQKGIAAVAELYSSGGHTKGGEYSVTIKRIKQVTSEDSSLRGMEAKYEVRNAEQVIVQGDGSSETSTPGTTPYLSYLIWVDNAWRTDVLEPR